MENVENGGLEAELEELGDLEDLLVEGSEDFTFVKDVVKELEGIEAALDAMESSGSTLQTKLE